MKIARIKQSINKKTSFCAKMNGKNNPSSKTYKAFDCRIDEEGNVHIKNPVSQSKRVKKPAPAKKQNNLAEGTTKNELLKGVLGHSKETMYRILNEYYEVVKKRFPGQKVTVFFNACQREESRHTRHAIAVAVNSDAPEGIMRSDEEIPGFMASKNADFSHVKLAYTYLTDKIDYEKAWEDVMFDLRDAIEEHKRKGMENEN